MRRLLALAGAVTFSGCVGPSAPVKKSLNSLIASERYAEAQDYLRGVKDSEYGPANSVLYDLDMALILHDAGQYKESNEHFSKAEDRMQELYTRSLTQSAGALLANENISNYPGETPASSAVVEDITAIAKKELAEPLGPRRKRRPKRPRAAAIRVKRERPVQIFSHALALNA